MNHDEIGTSGGKRECNFMGLSEYISMVTRDGGGGGGGGLSLHTFYLF